MKKSLITTALVFFLLVGNAQNRNGGYPITPISFMSVKITDDFWGERLKATCKVTIPLAFKKCEESGRYENFVKAAHPSTEHQFKGFGFDDTDVYKIIEGASYSMQIYPDKKLEVYIDSVLSLVAEAQEADGYLFTPRTMNPTCEHRYNGSERWEKVESTSHEFYNLGHMIEGAIAHYQATGKCTFLDIAIRYADCICREIGPGSSQQIRVPGHQIAEMALVKLYLVTGKKKYLNQAKFFLDERGHTSRKDAYSQAHQPVVEQDEAVGHAVRAAYMYSGMADVATLTGDSIYIRSIDKIWNNVVEKKLYLTGGIGARHQGEAFGDNYELPNATAYCETCAAIGNVYWNQRLFLLHGESKYYDVLERTLYNGLISGVSLDGDQFFYPNPLESDGKYKFSQGAAHRQPWFGCACCPSNISRFIPSLPGYVYAVKDDVVYINLFMSNTADLNINGKKISLRQTTNYPWDGDVQIEMIRTSSRPVDFRIRIPGWVQNRVLPSDLYTYADGKELSYSIKVNGKETDGKLKDGYYTINRKWQKGDKIEIHFDMESRVVKAHEKVEADRGRIAIERGPIVYCAEWPDNDFGVRSLLMPEKPEIKMESKPELLHGINVLHAKGQSLYYDQSGLLQTKQVIVSLIPYYAWSHRGVGEMMVWLPWEVNAVHPLKTGQKP